MVIRKDSTSDGALWGICRREKYEDEQQLLEYFPIHLHTQVKAIVNKFNSKKRRLEWLTTRALFIAVTGEPYIIKNDAKNRPYIEDNNCKVSLSHSGNYAAIIIHKEKNVGIDIETIGSKVERVADRFVNRNEFITPSDRQTHLLLHWSAKETIYKMVDFEGIDFARDIAIQPFIPKDSGLIAASAHLHNNTEQYRIYYETDPEYVITLSVNS